MKHHQLDCDVLIAGGGAAGVPAALVAARTGAHVVLCHDRPVLGGNASSEVRMHVVGANAVGRADRGRLLETEAREGGIIEEIRLENAVRNPQRSASMFDLILYDLCRSEPNLRLLLNTTVDGATLAEGRIATASASRPSTEECFTIAARVFIDCTGDGRLGLEAGAAYREGREAHSDFGESLALAQGDRQRLGSSLLIQARKHDRPMPFVPPAWARKFSRDDLRLRLYATPGEEMPSLEYGFWWAEWGGQLDTIADNEMIRDELLAVMLGIWDHIKNGSPGVELGDWQRRASHWALEWIGLVPGKRESRRFIGRHVLTQRDVIESVPQPDAIAYGGWPIDLHPPSGVDVPDESPCVQHEVPHLYDIPLRCCIARDIPNLMFAGRNISATHVAFASTRVMATCATVGQGVGTAAAIAVDQSIDPAEIPDSPATLERLQQQLLRDDVYLIGRVNNDPGDLARSATITASSEQAGAEAVNVISGQTRSVHGSRGAPVDRANPGLHRWQSDAATGLPAEIELGWPTEKTIGRVELIFDTGLHRHLTLTHLDSYADSMHWGQPQPETVCDYEITARTTSGWQSLMSITNNYQRRRVHLLAEPVSVEALKIVVYKTCGNDFATINEIRVYA